MGATVYGYPAREDIVAGQTYTVTMPHGMSDKRFADAVALVKGIGERPGSEASYDSSLQTWTVTLGAEAKAAVDDLRLAEAKYGADVVQVPGDFGYAQASAEHTAINTPKADPFAGIPNADDSLNEEFSPAALVARLGREYDIIERAGQAEYYLREARRAGLPLPGYVTIGAHNHGTWRSSQISLQLASTDEVSQWALHFGAEVVPGKIGPSVTLGDARDHDVKAYYNYPAPEVPGLAEHTQAAPKRCGACGRLAGMPTAPCGVCPDYAIRALSQHTQAACDTITKAARPDPDESCPRCGAVNWAVTPEGDDECVSCNYRPDTITKAAQ